MSPLINSSQICKISLLFYFSFARERVKTCVLIFNVFLVKIILCYRNTACEVGVKRAYIRMPKTVEGCFIGTISNISFLMSRSLSITCKWQPTLHLRHLCSCSVIGDTHWNCFYCPWADPADNQYILGLVQCRQTRKCNTYKFLHKTPLLRTITTYFSIPSPLIGTRYSSHGGWWYPVTLCLWSNSPHKWEILMFTELPVFTLI